MMPSVTINIAGKDTPLADAGNGQAGTSDFGHMWFDLNDGNGNTSSYGFGPREHGSPWGKGDVFRDDSSNYQTRDYSKTIEISQAQYEAMKNFADNADDNGFSEYDGLNNNCIDFTWGALKAAGLNPSGTDGVFWPTWNQDEIDELINFNNVLLQDLIDSVLWGIGIDPTVGDGFQGAQNWIERRDPLVLDLDNDGIETIPPLSTNPILFDHDGDGIKNGTGWIKSDDGFLVLDRNNNGFIDNGTELFGDSTNLISGGKAADGFAALADQDSNHDGQINAQDTNFNQLKVWRDLNQDGISQAEELSTLAQTNIASISLTKTANNQVLPNGNEIADLGTYTKTDGSIATLGEVSRMADVNLFDDTFHREFPDHIPLATGVEILPDMQGSGKVRDLREAASQSTRLKDLLTQFSAATTRDAQMALLDAWANTSGLIKNSKDRMLSNYNFGCAAIGEQVAKKADNRIFLLGNCSYVANNDCLWDKKKNKICA